MIHQKDLRIGDLIKTTTRNPILEKGSICKVVVIDAVLNLILVQKSDVDVRRCLVKEEIEGISLTPEILEKNGWKKKQEGWYIKTIDKYDYLSAEFGYKDGIRVFLKRFVNGHYAKLNTANNVHELQHILWALGEDANLKI